MQIEGVHEMDAERDEYSMQIEVSGRRRSIRAGDVVGSLEALPQASATVAPDLEAVDFAGQFRVLVTQGTTSESTTDTTVFTGQVVEAHEDIHGINISGGGALALEESQAGILAVSPGAELETVQLLCQQTEQILVLEGVDTPSIETFHFEVLLTGIEVPEEQSWMGVDLVPVVSSQIRSFGPFASVRGKLEELWGAPTARARAFVRAAGLVEADRMGMERVDLVINALNAQSSYAFSHDPSGNFIPFHRAQLRAQARIIPVVYSCALEKHRYWTHDSGLLNQPSVDLTFQTTRGKKMPQHDPADSIRLALASLRDASDESRSFIERCHSLSTTLEYYASEIRMESIVSRVDMKKVVAAIDSIGLDDQAKERLRQVVRQANQPPLFERVRKQAEENRVPVTTGEWELLKRIRKVRNDTSHGRKEASSTPMAEDLRWATSVVARLVMFRWSAEPATN